MKRKSAVLGLFVLLWAFGCRTKLEPERFSFPLEEEAYFELEGSPVNFDNGICVTDKGWFVDALKGKLGKGKEPKIIKRSTPEEMPEVKGKIFEKTSEGKYSWFGTDQGFVYCFIGRKKLWERRIGGGVISPPAIYKNLLFITSLDGHIYCFKKRTGTLLWIKKLPGRGKYPPVVIDETIIAPSLSKKLVAFDKDGNKKGNFELRGELKFPVFIKDKKIIAVSYDWEKERTYVQILRKKIGLEITLSPEPPVKIGDPVEIKVETFGFNTPEISFYINGKLLSRGEELKTLWMAEKEGIHKLKVEAKEGEVIREKEEEIEVVDPQKELYKKLLQIRKNCHCKR